MPAFRGRVNDEQAQDLTAYIRAFGPTPTAPSEVPASDFERRFRELQDQWNELQKQLESLPPAGHSTGRCAETSQPRRDYLRVRRGRKRG